VTTHGASASHQKGVRHRDNDHGIGWLSAVVKVHQRLGSTDTTAQVHPGKFTQAIMKAAQAQGAELRIGRVTGVVRQGNTGRVEGVLVDGEKIDGDAVVIAMGPWSILAAEWLPLPTVFGLKGHSLVFDTDGRLPADALFIEYREATGAVQAPEVFPRSDGTTYVCAISSDSPLPIDPADVAPDPGAIERLLRMCHELSPALASAKVLARPACYRPIIRDGLPLIGRVADVAGAYVATGHSVWGILNAPATGEAMAELIVDGATHTLDLSPFNPGRIPALDPARLRGNP
jgi:glycine/D-amino acid oxidase-like deaminating enzyme